MAQALAVFAVASSSRHPALLARDGPSYASHLIMPALTISGAPTAAARRTPVSAQATAPSAPPSPATKRAAVAGANAAAAAAKKGRAPVGQHWGSYVIASEPVVASGPFCFLPTPPPLSPAPQQANPASDAGEGESSGVAAVQDPMAAAPSPPTPVFPSGPAMADFLLVYSSMLEHMSGTGDSLAAAGDTVLERVRIGLNALLNHPNHGHVGDSKWYAEEIAAEQCLEELEKDLNLIHSAHDKSPARMALRLTSVHCHEAATHVRKL